LKEAPDVAADALVEHLALAYDIKAVGLEFVPKGDIGSSFLVDTADGAGAFCKLFRTGAGSDVDLARVEATARLARRAKDSGVMTRLAAPLAAGDGSLLTCLGPWWVMVQERARGRSLGGLTLPDHVAAVVGQEAARLHAATDALAPGFDYRDDIKPPTAYVRDSLAAAGGDPAVAAAVLGQRDRIEQALADCHVPAAGAYVVNHGDLIGDNLVVDGEDVTIVDWDSACLAPPENDLAPIAWLSPDQFGVAVDAYAASWDGPLRLDPAVVRARLLRYNLYCIGFYITRLLRGSHSPEQVEADLGMLAWCTTQWDVIDASFALARHAFSSVA
jgi:Ser/Thr protein kinase RdoA (MazF antagonist)